MSNRFPADDEHLHKYPGNLKHHKVDKKEQRKLLCEMMKDDAKSGLYNEKKREPLLSDKRIGKAEDFYDECTGPQGFEAGAEFARDYYESLITTGKLRVVEEDAINQIIKAGDSIASEVESRQSTERMMSEQFDLSKDQRDSHAIRAERMRRRLAAWTSAKSRLTAAAAGFKPSEQ